MRYVSTRGQAPELGFADALLCGLATDGGLYVPAEFPKLGVSTARSYVERAVEVMLPFVEPDLDEITLTNLCDEAYATFRHDAVTPLVQLDHRHYVMELFHGPTLAFKDIALQLLGRLFAYILKYRGAHLNILGATSGDTGSAAIAGVRGQRGIDIFILYPHGRVSPLQALQMTTTPDANVHCLAIDGSFDDCQNLMKGIFADLAFKQRHRLGAVNSVNWARVLAQVFYCGYASLRTPEPASFCVPTGNFGNVFAGYIAKRRLRRWRRHRFVGAFRTNAS